MMNNNNNNNDAMYHMIQTGMFGGTAPMQQNNNYVFQPLNYGYNQPRYDYYNPYGNTFGNTFGNNYYNPYGGYYQNNGVTLNNQWDNGYYGYSPLQQQQLIQNQQKNNIAKRKFVDSALDIDPEKRKRDLQEKMKQQQQFNPQYNQMSYEDMKAEEDWQRVVAYDYYSRRQDQIISRNDIFIQQASQAQQNFNQNYADHSMFQFMENDFAKLAEEQWMLANCSPRQDRNLSRTYSSKDYNELLSMHRSSNPYVNELLDTSKYDNNIDDLELGNPSSIYELIMRRKSRLQEPVPTGVSDAEVQMRRHEWTNGILNQIYKKHGGGNNV